MQENLKTGTTTIGITYKDGVVVGSEHRATMGTLIAHKSTQKVFKIAEHMALTTAGLVGDAQILARYLRAEVELYQLKRGVPMSIKAASTLMANILNSRKFYPYWVQLIIAGVDSDGAHVHSLDAAGGNIPDIYVSTGSGSPYVYGVLEDHFQENMTRTKTLDIAIRSIYAAMKRDAASGNGMDLVTISMKAGWTSISQEDIQNRIKKMKLN